MDCSVDISKEHYISKALLKVLLRAGGKTINFSFPWNKYGEYTKVGINSLVANVLCRRHNSALSPLDAYAAEFFLNLREVLRHATKKSLSKKSLLKLASGSAIELWVTKVLFGMYHAKLLSEDGKAMNETHSLDARLFYSALEGGEMNEPSGLYITPKTVGRAPGPISVTVLYLEDRIIGMSLRLLVLTMDVVFDPYKSPDRMKYFPFYSPPNINLKGPDRAATLMLTWRARRTRGAPDLFLRRNDSATLPLA